MNPRLTRLAALRLRQDRRGQGLCCRREARHVQPRCTYPTRAPRPCAAANTQHTHMLTHASGQGQVQQVAGAGQRRAEPEGR
jgi:hypothetical protein